MALTQDEWLQLQLLRAINWADPATPDALLGRVLAKAVGTGMYPVHKLDETGIHPLLAAWQRADPRLVTNDFSAADVDEGGRVREGARRVYTLTEAGEAEMARLADKDDYHSNPPP